MTSPDGCKDNHGQLYLRKGKMSAEKQWNGCRHDDPRNSTKLTMTCQDRCLADVNYCRLDSVNNRTYIAHTKMLKATIKMLWAQLLKLWSLYKVVLTAFIFFQAVGHSSTSDEGRVFVTCFIGLYEVKRFLHILYYHMNKKSLWDCSIISINLSWMTTYSENA